METKLMAMILAVALVLATTAVYTQSVFAANTNSGSNTAGQNNHIRGALGNMQDGQTAHGLATACAANPNVQLHNPNCPQAG